MKVKNTTRLEITIWGVSSTNISVSNYGDFY